MPVRVRLFDQTDFPFPLPSLDRFLSADGRIHRSVLLKPDEEVDAIFSRESFHATFLVLPDALDQVRGYAYVQGAVPPARHDVDTRLLHVKSRTGFQPSLE